MLKWLAVGAAVSLVWTGSAGAQMKGLPAFEIAPPAHTRAFDLRVGSAAPAATPRRSAGEMLVSREVAPNAMLGLGLASLGRRKSGARVGISGGPGRSRKPAVTFVLHF
jgi:hypothetical protein